VSRRARFALLGAAALVIVIAAIVIVGGGSSTSYTKDNPILTGDSVQKLRFKKGDTIKFRVKAPVDTEVHVHGYDLMKDLKKGETAQFTFPATIDGIFEVEFEETSKQIAELRVDP
jgi:hypothetical protein